MQHTNIAIHPALTLGEIFGSGHLFNPRASFTPYGWLPNDPVALDALTGGQLAVAGDLPVYCSQAVATEEGLSLLREAGLEIARDILRYRTQEDYREFLLSPGRSNWRVVMQHLHPPDELPAAGYWIAPELLSFLNNKANLGQLVPAEHTPCRSIRELATLNANSQALTHLPVVIKAASDQTSGGGFDVIICNNEDDVQRAMGYFSSCRSVVVEEFLPIERNLCVQFAATVGGQVVYLGTAEQVVDSQGMYLGNWLDPQTEAPEAAIAVGRVIMQRAVALGYKGIAGFDMAVLADGRVLVFDLNFRLNGSTVGILLYNSVVEALHMPVIRFRSWQSHRDFRHLLTVARMAIRRGDLVPLSTYNPEASPYPDATPRLSGLLLGSSREDVVCKDQLFTDMLAS